MPTLSEINPPNGAVRQLGACPVRAVLLRPASTALDLPEDWGAGSHSNTEAVEGALRLSPARITDIDDTTATLGTGTLTDTEATGGSLQLGGVASYHVAWSEDVEDGSIADWTFESGGSGQLDVVSSPALAGSYSLRVRNNATTMNAHRLLASPVVAVRVSVLFRITSLGSNDASIFRFTDAAGNYAIQLSPRRQSSTDALQRFWVAGQAWGTGPLAADTDYQFIADNIDWSAHTYDFRVVRVSDGVTIVSGSGCSMDSSTPSAVGGISVSNRNGDSSVAYYDAIEVCDSVSYSYAASGDRIWGVALDSLVQYRGGEFTWDATIPSGCGLVVESMVGLTSSGAPSPTNPAWALCTNGDPPTISLDPGDATSGLTLWMRVTETGPGDASPTLDWIQMVVVGDYPSSGYWQGPAHSLTPAGTAGSARAIWAASSPAGTSITIEQRYSGGSWTTVAVSGDAAVGIVDGEDQTGDTLETKITLATTDAAATPVATSLITELRPMFTEWASLEVNGQSFTEAAGNLAVWPSAVATGGVWSEDLTTVTLETRGDWPGVLAGDQLTARVLYAGVEVATATWATDELSGRCGFDAFLRAWISNPGSSAGTLDLFLCVVDLRPDLTTRDLSFLVVPPDRWSVDAWFLVAHNVDEDVPGGLIVGVPEDEDVPGVVVVRGWVDVDVPGAVVVQAYTWEDVVGALLVGIDSDEDVLGALLVGIVEDEDVPGALVVYGVNRNNRLIIRIMEQALLDELADLGITIT